MEPSPTMRRSPSGQASRFEVVPGEAGNVKLTSAEDIDAANRHVIAEAALALGDIRVGTGYDVHAFGPGNEVMLGGVAIPHTRGVVGHSDGDVALHALTDAVLGALADGDIGAHFPPSDPQWKGASSDRFLRFAVARVLARGGKVAHVDVAIITEGPRIAGHRDAIRARIAADLRHLAGPGRGQGDHQRESRLHRPERRPRRLRHRHHPPAVRGGVVTDLGPLLPLAREIIALCTERGLTIATAEVLHRRDWLPASSPRYPGHRRSSTGASSPTPTERKPSSSVSTLP